jgi:hypothetical protein
MPDRKLVLFTLATQLVVVLFVTECAHAAMGLSDHPFRCEAVFVSARDRLAALGWEFTAIYADLHNLQVSLVQGQRTPHWSDLDQLESLITRLREAKQSLTTPEAQAEFDSAVLQIVRTLDDDPQFKAIATAHRTYQPSKHYKPTEYKLKLEYQKLLGKLNRELPHGARIPIQRLPVDLRRDRINQEAREFMAEFEKSFERRFPTTGYKTYEEYVAALRRSEDPAVQKALGMLDKGQIEVVIRRPEEGRFWIPKVGIQNQYVTGSSRGAFTPEVRMRVEQRLYDIEGVDAYGSQDLELLPKYGTFRPKPESGVSFDGGASIQYGPDYYVLRLSDIKDRLSFVPTDSLGIGLSLERQPLTHWSGSFIPWRYRFMMVEFMRENLAKFNSMTSPTRGNWRDLVIDTFPFWETQILGGLDLSNVESFQFTGNPPSGAFLNDLLQRKIPIYDARSWPPVEWHPPESDIQQAKASRR